MPRRARTPALSAALTLVFCACSGGTMQGTIEVEGGSPSNVAVFIYGPVSTAAVSDAEGRFEAEGLSDGEYSLVARVRGAEVEEQTLAVSMKDGAPTPEPKLRFTMPGGSVTGRVAFADGSDASGVTVALQGPSSRSASTDAAGAFTFEKVGSGAWVVSVDVQDTREKRVGASVVVGRGAQDVGTLRLTPVGRVAGTVTHNGAPVGGASVAVAGTPLSAITDGLGNFEFPEVPAGDVTFIATAGAQRQLAASAPVQVLRGDNPELELVLGDATQARGRVDGVVTFGTPQSPTVITVSVPGLDATATPDGNGRFTLALPEGRWEVRAKAPFYPDQLVGRVEVASGQTVTLPAQRLSWYRPIFEGAGPLSGLGLSAAATATPWVVLYFSDAHGPRTYLFNAATLELRLLASGTVAQATISARAKYVAFVTGGALVVYDVGAGTFSVRGGEANLLAFSSDESVLFARSSTNVLDRITLATGVTTRFPATGTATAIAQVSADRWLVREGTNTTLVEPDSETAQVFTNGTTLFVSPIAAALTDCASNVCTLRVLAEGSRTARVVSRPFSSTTIARTSPPAFPTYTDGSDWFIVDASTGTATQMPTGTAAVSFSPDQKRYAARVATVGNYAVREQALPPTSSPALIAQSTDPLSATWLSRNRLVVAQSGSAPRIFDAKASGPGAMTVTTISDVSSATPVRLTGAMAAWIQQSTGRWRAIVGNSPTLTIPVDDPTSGPLLTAPPARAGLDDACGALALDQSATWLIDGRQGEVREVVGGFAAGSTWSGDTATFALLSPSMSNLLTCDPDMVVAQYDPRLTSPAGFLVDGHLVDLAIGDSTLWFGTLRR